MEDKILILDFGSQYTQLIARRVRELNVYCEIYPYNHFPEPDESLKGIILSGSPYSVRDKDAPIPDIDRFKTKIPILGICYGAQFLAQNYGGEVLAANTGEYGRAHLDFIDDSSLLLKGLSNKTQVWMSHGDTIMSLPENYKIISSTEDIQVGAFEIKGEPTYGLQFHPEVYHTTEGSLIIKNFLMEVCKCKADWTPESFIETTIAGLKQKIGDEKVVLGLS